MQKSCGILYNLKLWKIGFSTYLIFCLPYQHLTKAGEQKVAYIFILIMDYQYDQFWVKDNIIKTRLWSIFVIKDSRLAHLLHHLGHSGEFLQLVFVRQNLQCQLLLIIFNLGCICLVDWRTAGVMLVCSMEYLLSKWQINARDILDQFWR